TAEVSTLSLHDALPISQLGRLFRPDEDAAGAPRTILLSDAAWHRVYGADSSVVGRVISVNNLPHTVVGIMPVNFRFPENSEAWRSEEHTSELQSRSDLV